MQAHTATAKLRATISFSAATPELASQRNSTSTTVAPAATSMPMTPRNATGRVRRTQWRSKASRGCSSATSAALGLSSLAFTRSPPGRKYQTAVAKISRRLLEAARRVFGRAVENIRPPSQKISRRLLEAARRVFGRAVENIGWRFLFATRVLPRA